MPVWKTGSERHWMCGVKRSVHLLEKARVLLPIHGETQLTFQVWFFLFPSCFFLQKVLPLRCSWLHSYSSPAGTGHLWSQVATLFCRCDPGTASGLGLQEVVCAHVLPWRGETLWEIPPTNLGLVASPCSKKRALVVHNICDSVSLPCRSKWWKAVKMLSVHSKIFWKFFHSTQSLQRSTITCAPKWTGSRKLTHD